MLRREIQLDKLLHEVPLLSEEIMAVLSPIIFLRFVAPWEEVLQEAKKDMTTKLERDVTTKLELEVSSGEEKQELTSKVGPKSNSLDLAETKEPTDVAEEDTAG
jgi:hypothetical protein